MKDEQEKEIGALIQLKVQRKIEFDELLHFASGKQKQIENLMTAQDKLTSKNKQIKYLKINQKL